MPKEQSGIPIDALVGRYIPKSVLRNFGATLTDHTLNPVQIFPEFPADQVELQRRLEQDIHQFEISSRDFGVRIVRHTARNLPRSKTPEVAHTVGVIDDENVPVAELYKNLNRVYDVAFARVDLDTFLEPVFVEYYRYLGWHTSTESVIEMSGLPHMRYGLSAWIGEDNTARALFTIPQDNQLYTLQEEAPHILVAASKDGVFDLAEFRDIVNNWSVVGLPGQDVPQPDDVIDYIVSMMHTGIEINPAEGMENIGPALHEKVQSFLLQGRPQV